MFFKYFLDVRKNNGWLVVIIAMFCAFSQNSDYASLYSTTRLSLFKIFPSERIRQLSVHWLLYIYTVCIEKLQFRLHGMKLKLGPVIALITRGEQKVFSFWSSDLVGNLQLIRTGSCKQFRNFFHHIFCKYITFLHGLIWLEISGFEIQTTCMWIQ